MSDDRLTYLRKAEVRAEVVYAAGGDPTRYQDSPTRGIRKADARRIARQLQPDDIALDIDAMRLADLYRHICEWAGCEYQETAGHQWDLNKATLKHVHRALDAGPLQEVDA